MMRSARSAVAAACFCPDLGSCIRSWQSASKQCSKAAGRKAVTPVLHDVSIGWCVEAFSTLCSCRMRASAPTWAPASEHGSLPGGSASVQQEGDVCAQYCRNGTCSKGASCERLHGIYCKVIHMISLCVPPSRPQNLA